LGKLLDKRLVQVKQQELVNLLVLNLLSQPINENTQEPSFILLGLPYSLLFLSNQQPASQL